MFSLIFLYLSLAIKLCGISMFFALSKIVFLIPPIKKYAMASFREISSMENNSDFEDSLFGWGMLKTVTKQVILDSLKEAKMGEEAPNPEVLDLFGNKKKLLGEASEASQGRPVVLNFGSCS